MQLVVLPPAEGTSVPFGVFGAGEDGLGGQPEGSLWMGSMGGTPQAGILFGFPLSPPPGVPGKAVLTILAPG